MRKLSVYLLTGILLLGCSQPSEQKLQCFNLSDVKLLDGPFYKAQQADLKYMLELDVDRLLAPYLKDAGFTPKKENYGNWENTGLDGHIGGHYLSALSMMYAATGNQEVLRRLNYMVNWLDSCQIKNGNGYIGGIPDAKGMWNDIAQGKIDASSFGLNNHWVPLYNIHKLFAGLRDAYLYAGNEKALKILTRLTDWMNNLTLNLSDEQIQEMLKSEHGGLNEVFADLAEITNEKKYITLAMRFSHTAILDPLIEHKNELTGKHANTQIPKVIGFERISQLTGATDWDDAAQYFWDLVISKWTISIGGNSVYEHFHPTDDFSSMIESEQGPETCNTYNMLRLTKMLYLSHPDKKYLDYYERAIYNHILSSEHPTRGGFVYFTPMRPQHYRVYSQPQECFWCCVGSGLENHTKYGEMIYNYSDNDIFVNLFIASQLTWKEKGITITQNTQFPYAETSELKIEVDKPTRFTLNIRKPIWLTNKGLKLMVNGKEQTPSAIIDGFASINRKWQNGDVVVINLPMQTKLEYLPDSSNWVSIVHGPIVLAAATDTTDLVGLIADGSRMGHVASGPYYPLADCPDIIEANKDFVTDIVPVENKPLTYSIKGLVDPKTQKTYLLKPFFEVHDARYIVYWPVYNPTEYASKQAQLQEREKELLALQIRTIDQIAPGEQQPETEHHFEGKDTWTGYSFDKHWREGNGWFSYQLTNKNLQAKTIRITMTEVDDYKHFDILINNNKLTTVEMNDSKRKQLYDVDYQIPQNLSKEKILTITFQAIAPMRAGKIFYIRLLK
jgi:uncharacterized protein